MESLPDDPLHPWRVTRSARRRRETIVVLPDGMLELRCTLRTKVETLLAFARTKIDWVRRQRRKYAQERPPALPTDSILFRGETLKIVHDPQMLPGCAVSDGCLYVGGLPERMDAQVSRWLTQQTQSIFRERLHHWTTQIPRSERLQRLRIADTSSRWGSCSSSGTLSLCRRLIHVPPAVLDYVIIHELCHFSEMNHGKAFWCLVARFDPDYSAHRQWLAENPPKAN